MKSQNLKDIFTQDAYSLEVADKMANCFTNIKLDNWSITEHRCPKCNKAIKNLEEFKFVEAVKECFSCTHFRGDKLICQEDDKADDFCACGNYKMPNSDFCKECI